ncbi:protein of unknown function DUF945 (plasmid) [Deinococcus proteolyticus MRP]|uniref:DUF945 domain-containing protein n=1 Tax=Deinococcus proteolyticus (strain ATCC 35074 / DSM 20540 / JCM 6276 / NBRC 101906 / NCIMB 13154 / VKM Ac-1939 / CCM 2703 / MRP) TaxID=693977 RepID=F0RR18_DEIPM|nr:YdgA family protein [Deinococcus proteolyticus]ADY27727.1 protein of unknown function DUF945 [Deinococcus proteolyticus MRP]
MAPRTARPPSPLTLALAVPAALGLWAGTTAYASSAAQGATNDVTARLEQVFRSTGLLTVKESSYEKGFLKSTHRMIVQPIGAEDDPTTGWEVVNHIQHGPLAGGTLARAVVDTEIRFLDPEIQAQLDKAVGGQKPRIHTVLGLTGSSVTDLNVPAGQVQSQQDGGQVTWQPLTGRVETGSQGRLTGYNLTWPGMQFTAGNAGGNALQVGQMTLNGNQSYSSADDLIGVGKSEFKVAQLASTDALGQTAQLLNLTVGSETTLADPEHYDILTRYELGTLEVLDTPALGGLQLHLGMRHVARQPLQDMSRMYEKIRQQALTSSEGGVKFTPEQEREMEEVYSRSLLGLLQAEPVLSLDKAGFTNPGSGLQLSGQATFKGLAAALGEGGGSGPDNMTDLGNAMLLLPRYLQAQLTMRTSPETIEALNNMGGDSELNAADLVSSGTFRTEGNELVADFGYQDGQITINGKTLPGY